ncbi:uncharacterized protein O9250_006076 [Rhynochetos jubatus]
MTAACKIESRILWRWTSTFICFKEQLQITAISVPLTISVWLPTLKICIASVTLKNEETSQHCTMLVPEAAVKGGVQMCWQGVATGCGAHLRRHLPQQVQSYENLCTEMTVSPGANGAGKSQGRKVSSQLLCQFAPFGNIVRAYTLKKETLECDKGQYLSSQCGTGSPS